MASDRPDLAAAAAMLRAVVKALPPANAPERRTARRIEGAALALESAVDLRSGTVR